MKKLYTYLSLKTFSINIKNQILFNFNHQIILLSNIKKIIPEFYKITPYLYEKSKIK